MRVVTKAIRDNFNANNFLEISQLEMHDMYVTTQALDPLVIGPNARVYNLQGSGNPIYNTLYLYLAALADTYGMDDNPVKNDQFDFKTPVILPKNGREIKILDTPENKIYFRVASNKRYFGFQTLQKIGEFKNIGPAVWIDKQLPYIRDEAKNLEAAHKRAKPQPFVYEMAA